MNVAIVANPNFPVPPFEGYGSSQRGIYDLSIGLAEQGHSAYVFGSGDSTIGSEEDVELVDIYPHALSKEGINFTELVEKYKTIDNTIIEKLGDLASRQMIDAIHVRLDREPLVQRIAALSIPTLVSIPSCLPLDRVSALYNHEAYECGNLRYSAFTESHKKSLGNHDWLQIIPYGINMRNVPFQPHSLAESADRPSLQVLREFQESGKDYLLHLGAIAQRKGQLSSLDIARQAEMPLIIAGLPNRHSRKPSIGYFEELQQRADENVHFFGPANEQEKYELFSFARASLFCSGLEDPSFAEPFGRVLAESTATGTPVVGFRYGSFPEIIEEGTMGIGFSNIDEAAEKVGDVGAIDRFGCSLRSRASLSADDFISSVTETLESMQDNFVRVTA